MRHWPIALFACAFLLSVPAAQAEETNLRAARARKECYSGNYQAGVELLAELFAETRDANYIYNQARCFERNGRCSDAMLSFREFLRIAKGMTAAEKADVERRIAGCQGATPQPPPPAYQPPPPPPAVETTPAPGVTDELPRREVPAASPGAGLRVAGIVIASVGVAAVGAGVVFGWQAKKIADEVTSDNNLQTYDRKKDDRGKLFANLQWVGYGVGGAALAGGALLYYFGYRAQTGPVALLPVLGPDHAGAALAGRF
jgi:hypothetical protein